MQFDCPDCLQLEFHFQAHKLSGTNDYDKVQTLKGIVDLVTKELLEKVSNTVTKIRRQATNIRVRPNAHRRHDPIGDGDARGSIFKFEYTESLEYLSLNYRKVRAAKICPSNRRLVIIMF